MSEEKPGSGGFLYWAFPPIVSESFAVKREHAEDWMKATIDDAELVKIAEKRKRADTVEFKPGKAFVCKVAGDPRIIDTKEGPWEVIDVADQKGKSLLVSLGHTVLAKAIRSLLQRFGTLVGKVIVILPLGIPEGKRYFNYEVWTWEEYQASHKVK